MKPKHVIMRFTFTGIDRAFSFKNFLLSVNLPAAVDHIDRTRGWEVKTDSRCLAHAERLLGFLSAPDKNVRGAA